LLNDPSAIVRISHSANRLPTFNGDFIDAEKGNVIGTVAVALGATGPLFQMQPTVDLLSFNFERALDDLAYRASPSLKRATSARKSEFRNSYDDFRAFLIRS
jgi:hypothetical protein